MPGYRLHRSAVCSFGRPTTGHTHEDPIRQFVRQSVREDIAARCSICRDESRQAEVRRDFIFNCLQAACRYIQCISTVSRNVGASLKLSKPFRALFASCARQGFRIGQHLKEIAPLFLQIVNQDGLGGVDLTESRLHQATQTVQRTRSGSYIRMTW